MKYLTKPKTSKSADGKTWVMPEGKQKAVKKGSNKKMQTVTKTPRAPKTPVEKNPGKHTPSLASLEVAPKELVATYKGTKHKAKVNEDFTITVNGKNFNSPSRAGKEVTGREVDGWTFWSYKKGDGTLEKINALRKAVGDGKGNGKDVSANA